MKSHMASSIAKASAFACAVMLLITPGRTEGQDDVIDEDTIIDADFQTDVGGLLFQDGADGPIEVSIQSGGVVDGLAALGGSRVALDGGKISAQFRLNDDAILEIRSGEIGCTSVLCSVVSSEAFGVLRDRSTLIIRGTGPLVMRSDSIYLQDESRVIVEGIGLEIGRNNSPEQLITGRLLDGSPLRFVIANTEDLGDRIILREIPEPSTAGLVAISLLCGSTAARGVSRDR